MADSKVQRNIFWSLFKDMLLENGYPFYIYFPDDQSDVPYLATINKSKTLDDAVLQIRFSVKNKVVSVVAYIRDNLNLYYQLLSNKEEIDKVVSNLEWKRVEKNPSNRYIQFSENILEDNIREYERVINILLPNIVRFIEVLSKYTNNNFFD